VRVQGVECAVSQSVEASPWMNIEKKTTKQHANNGAIQFFPNLKQQDCISRQGANIYEWLKKVRRPPTSRHLQEQF
jgi:hypothetical protein